MTPDEQDDINKFVEKWKQKEGITGHLDPTQKKRLLEDWNAEDKPSGWQKPRGKNKFRGEPNKLVAAAAAALATATEMFPSDAALQGFGSDCLKVSGGCAVAAGAIIIAPGIATGLLTGSIALH